MAKKKESKITNLEELGKHRDKFPDEKEKKIEKAKESLYDLIDEIEKDDKELYDKILQSDDYQKFDEQMIKGEKTEEEIREKFEHYKKEFKKSSKSKSMEKPITKPEEAEKMPENSQKKAKGGEVKKKWRIENVYEEDRKDAESGEWLKTDIKEAEWRHKEMEKKMGKKKEEIAKTAHEGVEKVEKSHGSVMDIKEAKIAGKELETKVESSAQKAEAVIAEAEIEKAKEPEIKKEITEKEKREIQDYIYGDRGRHIELYKLWAGKSDEKEFSNGYRIPQEAEKAAFDFFQRREEYSKYFKDESAALRQYKKSGYKEGSVELETAKVWKINAEKALIAAQEELKRKLVEDAFAKKVSQYEERGVVRSDKDRKEEYAMITASMLPRIVELDGELEQMKMNIAYETKERGIFGKMWDKYKGLSKGKRLLASAAMSAGIGAGIAAFSPLGLIAGAGYVGYRAARTLGGGALGAGLNAAVDKLFIQKKYGTERREALSQQSEELRRTLLAEMESGDWKKEEKKMKLMEMLDNSALSLGGKYNDIAQREGKARMWTALGTGIVGGLTASGIDVYMMKPAGLSHSTAELFGGQTGGIPKISVEATLLEQKPEGIKLVGALEVHKGDTVWGIIDKQLSQIKGATYEHLGEARKTFTIDSLKDKVAAMSPDDLKKIGISSGNIDKLNIGDKIDFSKILADENVANALEGAERLNNEQITNIAHNNELILEYFKSHPEKALTGETIEKILHPGSKGGITLPEAQFREYSDPNDTLSNLINQTKADDYESQMKPYMNEVIAKLEEKGLSADEIMDRQDIITKEVVAKMAEDGITLNTGDVINIENLQNMMDSPEGKLGGLVQRLIDSKIVNGKSLEQAIDTVGSMDKLMKLKLSEFSIEFYGKLNDLAHLGPDAKEKTLEDVLKLISSKEIFGGTAEELIEKNMI